MAASNLGDSTYPQANLFSTLENFPDKKFQMYPHGVMAIKKCLTEEQQIAVLNIAMKIASQGDNEKLLPREKYQKTSLNAIPIMFYNWPARPLSKEIEPPIDLLRFATNIYQIASLRSREAISSTQTSACDERFKCPEAFDPNGLYAIMYPHGGKFGAHLDGAKGWVMTVSIGESAKFFWTPTYEGKREYLQVDSGDVVIFNGGQLYHGVDEIIPNTAPSFWTKPECPVSVFDMGRFSLQFRDPVRDNLSYDPYFPVEGCTEDES